MSRFLTVNSIWQGYFCYIMLVSLSHGGRDRGENSLPPQSFFQQKSKWRPCTFPQYSCVETNRTKHLISLFSTLLNKTRFNAQNQRNSIENCFNVYLHCGTISFIKVTFFNHFRRCKFMCKDISRNTLLDTHFIAIFSNHWKHCNPRKNVFYTIF